MKTLVWLCLALGLLTTLSAVSASGILNVGESIPLYNLKFQLDDLEAGSHNAVVSVWDANGNLLAVEEIAQGTSVTRNIAGSDYIIYVNKTAEGYTYTSKWASMTVSTGAGLLNAGEGRDFGGIIIRLDDLSLNDRDALVTIMDSGSGFVSRERIAEGKYVIRTVGGQKYKISAVQTSAGYLFASKWARMKVEPATLAESPKYQETSVGEVMANGTLRVRLDDLEGGTKAAIISILDSSDNVLSRDKIAPGASIIRAAEGGQKYKILAMDTALGYTFVAKWAKITAQTSALAETVNYPTIGVGESLVNGSAVVTLEDLESGTRNAIVTINDGSGGLYRERIAEGGYVVRTIGSQRYKIQVYQTAAGYMLNGRWAKLTVQPTTLPVTTSYPGSALIHQGEALIGPDDVKVRLDDFEVGTRNAIISILDSSDNIAWQEEITPSAYAYLVRDVGGTRYRIRIFETAPGYGLNAKWMKLSIETTTTAPTALSAGVVINQGEMTSCARGAYKVVLDDIELDSRDAIVTILDSNDNPLTHERIAEGQTKSFSISGPTCIVKVVQTAPGYTFGAKWARIQAS